jgi:sugar phosphate isomerase/epimerase
MKNALAAITDEFAADLETALAAMQQLGFAEAELRLIGGKNIVELTDAEIGAAREAVERRGLRVVSIASPVLKYVLPGGPDVDQRFKQDVFGASYTFDDHERLTRRAMDAAQALGARIVRVFSFWRTVDPPRCFPAIVDALRPLCDAAAARGLRIGLENEFACNVGTAEEAAALLEMLPHPALGLIWDPANMAVLGGTPFPDGYSRLPVERLFHVHVKDCTVDNFVPTWQRVGTNIDWGGQVAALIRDGYTGSFSLETHWRGEHGDRSAAADASADKLEASRICGQILRDLVADATAQAPSNRTGAPLLQDR